MGVFPYEDLFLFKGQITLPLLPKLLREAPVLFWQVLTPLKGEPEYFESAKLKIKFWDRL